MQLELKADATLPDITRFAIELQLAANKGDIARDGWENGLIAITYALDQNDLTWEDLQDALELVLA